jgi:LacI family transcriptional regulator
MTVTIKEIARRTGLSIPTVGNVLGSSAKRYSAETRRRILAAAEELGYRPNASARAMRNGRFGCAALILSRSKASTHSHIPTGLIDGLEDELSIRDMHLTVTRLTDEELSQNDFVPKVLRQHMADGMIVNYTHEIPPGMLELIYSHHTPAVWINARLPGDCVYPDDFGAAHTATCRLLELGHRRITLLHMISSFGSQRDFQQGWPSQHYSVLDRAAGYARAMTDAGLTPSVLSHEKYIDEGEQLAACLDLLSRPDRPTAVLAYSMLDATSLMCAASSQGLSVPRDLSVILFAPAPQWVGGRMLTAAAIPTEAMGRRAVQLLGEKLDDPDRVCPPVSLPYGLEGDATIAPPPSVPG